jgi:hypothetical protein
VNQEQLWEEEVTALTHIAAGLTYGKSGSGQGLLGRAFSKSSTLALTAQTLALSWRDSHEYPWSNIDCIGFPHTRHYSTGRSLNQVIWIWLTQSERGESQSSVGQLAEMVLAVDRRSSGDVLIPNARDTPLDQSCYGGFKQWQLLHLLQSVHTCLTGRTYTTQDFNFAVLKKEAVRPLSPIVPPTLLFEMIVRLRKISDEGRRHEAAKILVLSAIHTPNLMPFSAFGI